MTQQDYFACLDEPIEQAVRAAEVRAAMLQKDIEFFRESLTQVGKSLDKIDSKFTHLDSRLDDVQREMSRFKGFTAGIAGLVGVAASVAAVYPMI